jgi:hypothetical protein
MDEICINPVEIEEGDLMAYVDGLAEKAVMQHIQRCPACARQVAELATLQTVLTDRLYRRSCPSPDQLLSFQQDELDKGERLVIAQHLRQCPHCARELATLARDERAGLGDWLRSVIKVVDGLLVTPRLQPAAVRDASPASRPAPQVYQADEVEVIVQMQASGTHPHLRDLSCLVHIGGHVPETIGQAQAELYRGDGLVDMTRVSPRGRFVFEAVEPSVYDLSLVWGDREIRLKGIKVE